MMLAKYPDIWRTIPLAEDVFPKQLKTPVDDTIIKNITHCLEDRLCVVLNHRHFDLETGEKLVERGQISTPWLVNEKDLGPVQDRIVARTWTFFDGDFVPYEYKFCEDPDEKEFQPPPEFTSELRDLLEKDGMTDRLGFQLLDDNRNHGQYEITVGRVSMMLDGEAPDHVVSVGWRYAGAGAFTANLNCAHKGCPQCNRCC